MESTLKVALLTREYPPEVYGGAGVHVEYLARELAPLVGLTVHCQGADRPAAAAHRPAPGLRDAVLRTFSADLSMADAVAGADLVHSHTWYANLAGHLASLRYGIPHVMTMHSLEPLRPWKAEQLAEVTELVDGLRATRSGVFWIPEMLPKPSVVQLLTHAVAFACPSVYEPLGIVNLEAMACGTAVVASDVGGIPEVVDDGVTGLLVPPDDPAALADALNALLRDRDRARAYGDAGRARAVGEFSWSAIASETVALYRELTAIP